MKIKKITTTIETIPLKTPFITALRRVDNVEFVRVRIELQSGNLSFGEAPATKAITGEDLDLILNSIDSYKARLIGLSPQEAIAKLDSFKIGSSARAALDMALFNILNPLNNKTDKKTAITISLGDVSKMLADANIAYTSQNDILKLKFNDNINHAIEVTKKIKEQNPDASLLIDANQAWSYKDSITYIDAIKDVGIELIEQPVKKDELESLKKITEYSDIPIVADESCFTFEDVKVVVENKIADIINIKLMKCGGITKAMEILEYCRAKKVPVMMGSMLEGPTSIAYASSLVDAYKDVVKYVDLDSPLLYKENFKK
ncbi:dipeptide epimerase [Sulfurimonas lithotrophica]|uniref:Dipeptide epimerase n=1 Tax=Sulfurimonas lithotrophica TaxID=2590022 RepID=A0A5P8P2T8_9BACT|nr:dipeptide epimerase [Sulfurimonas lithotrophica]QFR50042.1 dipeptide epimerase [Sulfurimonas lithotrophica]